MKPSDKTKGWALILLFFVMFSSCRKPNEDYNYEDNDEPLTTVSNVKEAFDLVIIEAYPVNENKYQ